VRPALARSSVTAKFSASTHDDSSSFIRSNLSLSWSAQALEMGGRLVQDFVDVLDVLPVLPEPIADSQQRGLHVKNHLCKLSRVFLEV
jgi:hypothetical protein